MAWCRRFFTERFLVSVVCGLNGHALSFSRFSVRMYVLSLVDSHVQRINITSVFATEKTVVAQQVSHRPIKCQSRSWPQRCTKVNGSHHGDNPLLHPARIQIATKFLPGPTAREYRNFWASRRYLWVRTTVSTVWSVATISEFELQATTLVAPVVQWVTSKPSDVGTRVRIPVQSHELGFLLTKIKNKKCPTSGERLIR